MSKLYTKTGDKGTTNLYDMRRVSKTNPVFEALGDIDELSAHIGMLYVKIKGSHPHDTFLRKIQSKLLDVGSSIATVQRRDNIVDISEEDVFAVENAIDDCESRNTPLREFILPGVYTEDSIAHVCRAVSRRAERSLWRVREEYNQFYTSDYLFIYMNRLSDYFFALSRNLCNCKETKRSEAV
jgi:cob(I)alamin adenosyltransferase